MVGQEMNATPRSTATSVGSTEYVDIVSGSPVLFVHRSPGGCDQVCR